MRSLILPTTTRTKKKNKTEINEYLIILKEKTYGYTQFSHETVASDVVLSRVRVYPKLGGTDAQTLAALIPPSDVTAVSH